MTQACTPITEAAAHLDLGDAQVAEICRIDGGSRTVVVFKFKAGSAERRGGVSAHDAETGCEHSKHTLPPGRA